MSVVAAKRHSVHTAIGAAQHSAIWATLISTFSAPKRSAKRTAQCATQCPTVC